jgi:hypothetical protein
MPLIPVHIVSILRLNSLRKSLVPDTKSLSSTFPSVVMLLKIVCLAAVGLTRTIAVQGAPVQRTQALDAYDGTLQIRDYTFVRRGGAFKNNDELKRGRKAGYYKTPASCPFQCMREPEKPYLFSSPLRIIGHFIEVHGGVEPLHWRPPAIKAPVYNRRAGRQRPLGETPRTVTGFTEIVNNNYAAAARFQTNCLDRIRRGRVGPSTQHVAASLISDHLRAVQYGATRPPDDQRACSPIQQAASLTGQPHHDQAPTQPSHAIPDTQEAPLKPEDVERLYLRPFLMSHSVETICLA